MVPCRGSACSARRLDHIAGGLGVCNGIRQGGLGRVSFGCCSFAMRIIVILISMYSLFTYDSRMYTLPCILVLCNCIHPARTEKKEMAETPYIVAQHLRLKHVLIVSASPPSPRPQHPPHHSDSNRAQYPTPGFPLEPSSFQRLVVGGAVFKTDMARFYISELVGFLLVHIHHASDTMPDRGSEIPSRSRDSSPRSQTRKHTH